MVSTLQLFGLGDDIRENFHPLTNSALERFVVCEPERWQAIHPGGRYYPSHEPATNWGNWLVRGLEILPQRPYYLM